MVKNLTRTAVALLAIGLVVAAVPNASAQSTDTVVVYEAWTGIGGTAVADLTGNAHYQNDPPDVIQLLTGLLEGPTDWADNFGGRMRFYIHVPTTGDYTFWINTDDSSGLYLSTDDNPANLGATPIADTTGWAPSRDWGVTRPDVHPSAPIPLVAGQRYYMEGLYKEGGGGDNIAIGWQGPGITGDTERPIPLSRVSPYFGTYVFSAGSVVRTMPAAHAQDTTFTVTLTASPGFNDGPMSATDTIIDRMTLSGAGITLSNPVSSGGGSAVITANSIQWDIPNMSQTTQTLTYDVTVSACAARLNASGTWTGGDAGGNISGASNVWPSGIGWGASPIPWTGAVDIGPVATPGASEWVTCNSSYLLSGSGADVWGTDDQCQFLYVMTAGDFTIAGDFEWLQTVNTWSKMGLMIRADLTTSAPTITTQVTDQNCQGGTDGQRFGLQYRLTAAASMGGLNANLFNWEGVFLAMSRSGGTTQTRIACLGDPDDDWNSWHGLRQTIIDSMGNSRQVTIPNAHPLAGNCPVGLFVVGHSGANVAYGFASNVVYSPTTILGTDVGVSRNIVAPSYMAGGAPTTVSLFMTAADTTTGTVTVTETLPAGWTASILAASAGTPNAVGNVVTWTVDSDLALVRQLNYLAMPGPTACGDFMPSGLYDYGAVQAILGRQIQVTGDQVIGQTPDVGDIWQNSLIDGQPWDNAADIGPVGAAGNTVWYACDGRYEVTGNGGDIWGSNDRFQFLYVRVHDDFQLQADVSWPVHSPYPSHTHDWAKAGLVVREGLANNSPNYMVLIRWGNGERRTRPQYRDAWGNSAGPYFTTDLRAGPDWPVRMTLSRTGSVVQSTADELSTIAPPEVHSRNMGNIPRVCWLGLGVTSHRNDARVITARFENVVATINKYVQTFTGPVRSVDVSTANVGVDPVTVTIGVPHLANGTSITIVDDVVGVVTNAGGGTVAGGQISWTFAWNGVTTQVSYTFIPYYPGSMTYNFSGYVEDYAGYSETIPDQPVTLMSPLVGGSRAIDSEGSAGTWIYGSDRVNTVTLTIQSDDVSSLVITDQVPPGWEIISVIGGTEPSTGTAEWTVTGVTTPGTTVQYTCRDMTWDPSEHIPPPVIFPGGQMAALGGVTLPIPESAHLHHGVLALQDGAWAGDVPDPTYNGTDDTYIIIYQPDNNMGAHEDLEEGDWNDGIGDHKKVLVQFTPPAGMSITSAQIYEAEVLLYYFRDRTARNANHDHTVRAQRILQQWIEGTGGAAAGAHDGNPALAGEVTFNSSAQGTATWGIRGLMDGLLDSGPFSNPSNVFGSTQNVWVHVDVTNDVKAYVDGTRVFYGWKISQDQVRNVPEPDPSNVYNTEHAYNFVSSENPDVNHRPMLLIKTILFVPVEVSRFYLY